MGEVLAGMAGGALVAGACERVAAAAAALAVFAADEEVRRRFLLPLLVLAVVERSAALSPPSASSPPSSPSSLVDPEIERPPGTLAGPPGWVPGMFTGLAERPIGVPIGIDEGSWP